MDTADYLRQLAVSLDLALIKRGLTLQEFSAELGCPVADLENIRDRQADPSFSLAMKILAAADYPGLMSGPGLSRLESKLDTFLSTQTAPQAQSSARPYLSAESKDRLAAVGADVGSAIGSLLKVEDVYG